MSPALLSTRGLSAQLQMAMSQPNVIGFRRSHRSVGTIAPIVTPIHPQCSFSALRLPTVFPPARPAIPAIAALRTRSPICSWRPRAASDAAAAGETDTPEHPKLLNILSFQDICFYINTCYFSLLLLGVLTGWDLLSRITHFEYYTTAMFFASALFTAVNGVRFLIDAGKHLKKQAEFDWAQFLRCAWSAAFWLGFVLWYAAPPLTGITEWTGTPGAIMCIFGFMLAISAAMTEGLWSFMGEPQVPQKLTVTGPYAISRHPQALGNMLFLIGFSVAGGAVAATAAFLVSFLLYHATVVPKEEALLLNAFGEKYEAYRRRTPSYAYALLLLVLLEVALIWRLYPYSSTPVGPQQGTPTIA